jgi:hypothetical protein
VSEKALPFSIGKTVEPSTKMVDGSTVFWYHSIRDFTPAGLPQTFH